MSRGDKASINCRPALRQQLDKRGCAEFSLKGLKRGGATNSLTRDRSQQKYPNGKTIGVLESVRTTQCSSQLDVVRDGIQRAQLDEPGCRGR